MRVSPTGSARTADHQGTGRQSAGLLPSSPESPPSGQRLWASASSGETRNAARVSLERVSGDHRHQFPAQSQLPLLAPRALDGMAGG